VDKMKNLLKLTTILFGALFLFACDSSSTGKTAGSGTTFSISANVTGLKGSGLILFSGTEIKDVSSNGLVTLNTSIAKGSSYNIGVVDGAQPSNPVQTCNVGTNAVGDNLQSDITVEVTCSGGGNGGGNSGLVGSRTSGKDYYMSECAVCHRSGSDDIEYTFSSNDIANDYQNRPDQAAKDSYITEDMHAYGPASKNHNLMGRFDTVPAQSVADLKAYLESVTLAR
jgi:hypothetical protein